MHFSEHKFAEKIDEKGYNDRNQNEKKTKDKQKQKNILIANFFTCLISMQRVLTFFLEISKMQNYITQSNKKTKRTRKHNNISLTGKQNKKKNKIASLQKNY